MKAEEAWNTFNALNFAQKFLAFILLVQISSLMVGLVMRIFAEFGHFQVALGLYVVFIVVGVILMFILIASLRGKSGSHFTAAIAYFLITLVSAGLVIRIEGGIFTIFAIRTSILATWFFTNFFFSILILTITLIRLIVLGTIKDYQRPSRSNNDATIASLKEELERLKQEAAEMREKKD